LTEAAVGLAFTFSIPDTSYGRDLIVSAKRGDISGMSFSFRTVDDVWTKKADGTPLREVIRGTLFEISPVTNPTYPQTTLGLSSGTTPARSVSREQLERERRLRAALIACGTP
jgi:uncharacterized protein